MGRHCKREHHAHLLRHDESYRDRECTRHMRLGLGTILVPRACNLHKLVPEMEGSHMQQLYFTNASLDLFHHLFGIKWFLKGPHLFLHSR